MLKLKIKAKNEGMLSIYSSKNTNVMEHLMGIAKLYLEIKENQPEVTDEEIHDIVMNMLKEMEEED